MKKLTSFLTTTLSLSFLSGCTSFPIEMPFHQLSNSEEQKEYLVVVTFARVNNGPDSSERFDELLDDVLQNIDKAPHLHGYSLRKELFGKNAWTYTIWENHEGVNTFKVTREHLTAMTAAPEVLAEAKFARLTITSKDLPWSWEKSLSLLESGSRNYRY